MRPCLSLSALALTLIAAPLAAQAPAPPPFVTDAQIPIPSSDGFLNPHGLAVAPGGVVTVADTGNHRLLQITPAGVQTTVSLGQFGPALQAPTGLARDAAGNLYVTDPPTNRLIKLPANGSHAITILAAPVLNQPTAVASDAAGNLAVVNAGNNTVVVRRASGPPVVFSTGSTVLATPVAVAFDPQGFLYIADAGSATAAPAINRFPALGGTGTVLTPAGYPLQGITGLAIDAGRNLYVLTAPDRQLLAVPASGAAPFVIPQTGTQSPSGLTLDNLDNLYVADTTSVTKVAYGNAADFGALRVGSPSGAYTFNFAFYTPTAITATQATPGGSTGQEYLRQSGGTCAARNYYPTSNALGTPLPATCTLRFNFRPTQVGGRPGAVQVVTSSGTASQLVTGIGLGGQLALLNAPVTPKLPGYVSAVLVNAAETELYYCGSNGAYKVPTVGGTPTLLYPSCGQIALNGAGDLFVLHDGTVTKIPGDGSPATDLVIPGLVRPQSIVADSNGALYINDFGPTDPNQIDFIYAGFILRVSLTGVVTKFFPDTFQSPFLINTDGQGNIVVADDRLFLEVETGTGSFRFTNPGPVISGYYGADPVNLSVDASGTLYYEDPFDFAQGFVYAPPVPGGFQTNVPGEYFLPLYGTPAPNPNFESPYNFSVPAGNQVIALGPSGKMYIGGELVNRTLGVIAPQAFNPAIAENFGNPQMAFIYNVGNQSVTFTDPARTYTESGTGSSALLLGPVDPNTGERSCLPGTVLPPSAHCALTVTSQNPLGPGPVVTDTLHFLTDAVNNNLVSFRISTYAPPAP